MTKRYTLLLALLCAFMIKANSPDENATRGVQATIPADNEVATNSSSTFYYSSKISGASIAAGTTISSAGYYLARASATCTGGTAITINASGVTLDLEGHTITRGGGCNTAISIANNVSNVTIKNGNFVGAYTGGVITVGDGASHIVIDGVNISGAANSNVGIIDATGGDATTNAINNLTLNNVNISKCTSDGTSALYPVDINFAHNVTIKNVSVTNNTVTASMNDGAYAGIRIQNSTNINARGINSTKGAGDNSTIGLEMVSCDDANLFDVTVSSNADVTDGATTTGLKLTSCDNVIVSDLSANSLAFTKNSIWILNSNQVLITNFTGTSCTSGATTAIDSVLVDGSNHVSLTKGTIGSNTTTAANYRGIVFTNTCKNCAIDGVDVTANTATTDGTVTGIDLASTNGIAILNCLVAENASTDSDDTRNSIGLNAASSVNDLYIGSCSFVGQTTSTGSTTATGALVAGVYLNGVNHCSIEDTTASRNNGASQAFGFYVESVDYLIMDGCVAQGNASATTDDGTMNMQDENDGLEQLPSAGLYLLTSDHATVQNSNFNNNLAGNYARGAIMMEGTPAVATSCSGHGVANVGTNAMAPNIGNSFVNCTFQGNGTQLLNSAPIDTDMMMGSEQYNNAMGTNYHWISEAFAAGATENFTTGSTYTKCTFGANGHQSDYVVAMGLCVLTGSTSINVVKCSAHANNFYGFYDSTASNSQMSFTGCISSVNGTDNSTVASVVESNGDSRNFKLNGATALYTAVTTADLSGLDPIGTSALNISVTQAS